MPASPPLRPLRIVDASAGVAPVVPRDDPVVVVDTIDAARIQRAVGLEEASFVPAGMAAGTPKSFDEQMRPKDEDPSTEEPRESRNPRSAEKLHVAIRRLVPSVPTEKPMRRFRARLEPSETRAKGVEVLLIVR